MRETEESVNSDFLVCSLCDRMNGYFHSEMGTPGREFDFSRKIMNLNLDLLALGYICHALRGDIKWAVYVGLKLRKI